MTTTRTDLRIIAGDMYAAQSVKLTPADRKELQIRADEFRALTGTTEPTAIRIPVYTAAGAHIGGMTYMR